LLYLPDETAVCELRRDDIRFRTDYRQCDDSVGARPCRARFKCLPVLVDDISALCITPDLSERILETVPSSCFGTLPACPGHPYIMSLRRHRAGFYLFICIIDIPDQIFEQIRHPENTLKEVVGQSFRHLGGASRRPADTDVHTSRKQGPEHIIRLR